MGRMSITFEQPLTELVRHRSSWRAYEPRSIMPGTLQALESRVAALRRGPFGHAVRVGVCRARDSDTRSLGAFGTYGVIRGARHYLVGAVKRGERDLEDFGYVFELAVLIATDLGLGTCWLGGTFDRSAFGELIKLDESERLPAVSPVGYATTHRSWRDHVIRLGAGSHKRHPWERMFFNGAFGTPLNLASAGPLAECLEMVRLGPSASNQQPWRVIRDRDGSAFHFYQEHTAAYRATGRVGMNTLDLQRLSMGIALCHFEQTARALDLKGAWETWDPAPSVGKIPEHTVYLASWNLPK